MVRRKSEEPYEQIINKDTAVVAVSLSFSIQGVLYKSYGRHPSEEKQDCVLYASYMLVTDRNGQNRTEQTGSENKGKAPKPS